MMIAALTFRWIAAAALLTSHGAFAQDTRSVADFYRGKTINLIVGSDSGGGYDFNARMLARHMGRHIPGNPNFIVQNMPGASSIVAANYVYNIAPKDGSVIAAVQRPIPFETLFNAPGVRFDATRIYWLGSSATEIGVAVAWHSAPQQTLDDVIRSEMVVGGNGPSTDTELLPRAFNNLLNTKFRIVSGYPGEAQIILAMERGEVQGVANWSLTNIFNAHPDWLAQKKIRLLVQLGLKKHPDIPDVPLILDLARTPQERRIFEILMGMKVLGRPFFVSADVPAERREALRQAFMATMTDAEFLAEAKRARATVDPVSGPEMQRMIDDLNAQPADVLDKARAALR